MTDLQIPTRKCSIHTGLAILAIIQKDAVGSKKQLKLALSHIKRARVFFLKEVMLITLISIFYYEGVIDKAGDLVTFFSKERINMLTRQFPFFCRIHKDVLEHAGCVLRTP